MRQNHHLVVQRPKLWFGSQRSQMLREPKQPLVLLTHPSIFSYHMQGPEQRVERLILVFGDQMRHGRGSVLFGFRYIAFLFSFRIADGARCVLLLAFAMRKELGGHSPKGYIIVARPANQSEGILQKPDELNGLCERGPAGANRMRC